MAFSSVNRLLKNDAGQEINSLSISADDYSETLNLNGYRKVGIWVDAGTFTGTSPTCDIKVEWSADGGSNWVEFPVSSNSVTQAALVQLTTSNDADVHFEYWDNVVGSPLGRLRFFFDLGGTSPVCPLTCRVIAWDRTPDAV
jgi:hypothetical protein